jgi:uncharacterized DUF497 family protein
MVGVIDSTFDPAKNLENIRRRGLPLSYGEIAIANSLGVVEETRFDYGEVRLKASARIG